MPLFHVYKFVRMDYGLDIEAETEEEALEKARSVPLENWDDEGCDTGIEAEEYE